MGEGKKLTVSPLDFGHPGGGAVINTPGTSLMVVALAATMVGGVAVAATMSDATICRCLLALVLCFALVLLGHCLP